MIARTNRFVAVSLIAAPLWFSGCGSSTSSNPGGTGGAVGTGGRPGAGGAPGSGGAGGRSGSGGAGGMATGGNPSMGGSTPTGGNGNGATCSFGGGDVTAASYPNGLTLTKACSPFTVADIVVKDGGVLTIEAGVTLQFEVNTAISVATSGTGKLLANGTAASPILLTSQERAIDGEGWYGLQFYPGTVSGSLVTYTQIQYAGGNFDAAIVSQPGVPRNSVTLDHVAISMNVSDAVGILSMDAPSSFVTRSCTLDGVPTP